MTSFVVEKHGGVLITTTQTGLVTFLPIRSIRLLECYPAEKRIVFHRDGGRTEWTGITDMDGMIGDLREWMADE